MGIIVDIYKAYEKMEGNRKALPFVFKLLGLDLSTLDGGEGSGNFNHAGRPGKIGGSASEGGSGASGGTSEKAPSKWMQEQERRRGIASKWSNEQKAEHLFRLGFLSEDDAVKAMEDGTVQENIDKYFDIMEENGDPTPTKPLRKQVELYGEIKEGKHGGDWDQARIDYIKDWAGMNDEEAQTAFKELKQWVSFGAWDKADTSVVDDYIDRDGAYDGDIYRGMHFSEDEYAAFMEQIAVGNRIGMNGRNSSWSNDKESAWHFSKNGDRHVIIHCKKNKTAAPIDHIAGNGEEEVVAHSKTLWTVIGIREGDGRTEIDVIEAEDRMTEDEYERRRSMLDSALPEKQEENKNEKTLGDRMNAQQKYFFVIPRKPRDTMSAADGGPGSGNWGHKGRPGKVGGSGKGGGKQYRGGRADIAYVGSRKDWLNGLSGEEQAEAQKLVNKMQSKITAAKKIRSMWSSGALSAGEMEEALKKGGLEKVDTDATVEENILESGDEWDKAMLIGYARRARNWFEHSDRLIKDNLSEEEQKAYEVLARDDKMRREFEGYFFDLEAKAVGLTNKTSEMPEELQYEAGIKERPKATELKPEHMASCLKPKPTQKFLNVINSVEGRDADVVNLYTKLNEIVNDGLPADVNVKTTYTDQDKYFRIRANAFTGKVSEIDIHIPKMTDEDAGLSEAATTAHEIAHMIDFMRRETDKQKYGQFNERYLADFEKAMKADNGTPEEIDQLFRDTDRRCRDVEKKIQEDYQIEIDRVRYSMRESGEVLWGPPKSANVEEQTKLRREALRQYKELEKKKNALEREMERASDKAMRKESGGIGVLEDIFQALGSPRRLYGHNYRSTSDRLSECWADWCELSLAYPEERKILEKHKPELCAIMRKMTQEILGEG